MPAITTRTETTVTVDLPSTPKELGDALASLPGDWTLDARIPMPRDPQPAVLILTAVAPRR